MPPKAIRKGYQRSLAFFRGISVSQEGITDEMRTPATQQATKSQREEGEIVDSDEERNLLEEAVEEEEAGEPFDLAGGVAARFAASAAATPASARKGKECEQDGEPGEVRNDEKERVLDDAMSILRETGAFKIPVDYGRALDSSQASTSASLPARRGSSKQAGAFGAKLLPSSQESLVHLLSGTFPSSKRLSGKESGMEEQEKKKKKKKREKEEQRELRIRQDEKRRLAKRMKAWEYNPELELSPELTVGGGLEAVEMMEEEERMEKEDQRMEEEEELEEGELRDEPQERSNSSVDAHSQQLEEEDERGLRERGGGRSRGSSPDAHSSDLHAFDDEEDEEEAYEDGDEEMDEMDEQEEEDEEMDEMDEQEEEELAAAELRVSVAKKIIRNRGCALRKDREKANTAEIRAAERVVDDAIKSAKETCKVHVAELQIEDEEEIDEARVSSIMECIKDESIDMKLQVMTGWRNASDGQVYIVDGRHRLSAYKKLMEEAISARGSRPSRGKQAAAHYEVTVEIMNGGKLAAHLRKMAKEKRNIPTAFEKVRLVRYIMAETGMLHSSIPMKSRVAILNRKIYGPKMSFQDGVARYTANAACFNDDETKFMMSNARMPVDNTSILKLYCSARSVNKEHAWEILQKLDGEDDKTALNEQKEALTAMKSNISELLQAQGYSKGDADHVQSRIYKNQQAFTAIRRLMSGRNRLSRVKHNVNDVLVALERCYPPVTFTYPQLEHVQYPAVAPSTLFIIDSEAFYSTGSLNIPQECAELVNAQESRALNFLIVRGDVVKVKAMMKKAIEELRMQRRRADSSPLPPSQVTVAAEEVFVECAPYEQNQAGSTVVVTRVRAVMMRAYDGLLLDDTALASFMGAMKMQPNINRTCLRLLTYDTNLDAGKTKNNTVFVCSTTDVAAIAVAAHCSANRLTTLSTMPRHLASLLRTLQANQDGNWASYEVYKKLLTVDGTKRAVEGATQSRKRKSRD